MNVAKQPPLCVFLFAQFLQQFRIPSLYLFFFFGTENFCIRRWMDKCQQQKWALHCVHIKNMYWRQQAINFFSWFFSIQSTRYWRYGEDTSIIFPTWPIPHKKLVRCKTRGRSDLPKNIKKVQSALLFCSFPAYKSRLTSFFMNTSAMVLDE